MMDSITSVWKWRVVLARVLGTSLNVRMIVTRSASTQSQSHDFSFSLHSSNMSINGPSKQFNYSQDPFLNKSLRNCNVHRVVSPYLKPTLKFTLFYGGLTIVKLQHFGSQMSDAQKHRDFIYTELHETIILYIVMEGVRWWPHAC